MDIFGSAWDLLCTTLVFLIGAAAAVWGGRQFRVPDTRALVMYLWHTIFSISYLVYSLQYSADSIYYFSYSTSNSVDFGLGTPFVVFFTSWFSKYLGLSYLSVFLVYNILGYFGMLAFYGAIREVTSDKSRLVQRLGLLIVMLPSVSFWSSAIGKDAISFMSAGLALWAAQDMRRRSWLLVAAVCVMLVVRPHIAAVMVCALAVSMVFSAQISAGRRLIIGAVTLIGLAAVLPLALDVAGLNSESSTSDVTEFVDQRQEYNQYGGSGIDISTMSLPAQLFTYIFRPLPYEAGSVSILLASFDNTILLGLALASGIAMVRFRKRVKLGNRVFLWVYALGVWVIMAMTTANLGIAARQKWMFLPMLIALGLSMFAKATVAKAKSGEARGEIDSLGWQ